MAKQRIILVLVVCLSLTVFTGQTLSLARSSKRTRIPPVGPDPKRLLGLTAEERGEEIKKLFAQRRQQEQEKEKERMNLMVSQAWKRLLRVTDRQWNLIEPKYEKVARLYREKHVGAAGGGRNKESFRWKRPSESPQHPMKGKARDQMPEGYRIVEELIDLLEDENAKEKEIRLKIDALQRAREKAKKELPKAKKELAAVLTSPRQQAVFLLMGSID